MAAVNGRWLVVLLTAVALVVTPLAVRARTTTPSDVGAPELVQRIRTSSAASWSGQVESSGTLAVPNEQSFANLAQLLGESNELRVWWRGPADWRIDRIRSTGETDLYRQGQAVIRWVFESDTATVTPVSTVRLPDVSDLLPPTLGRALLQGARADELARLPTRRVAGVEAPGVRLTPGDPASTVGRVDVWADPETGLPLRVELSGLGEDRPTLTTALTELDRRTPPASATVFRPSADSTIAFEESVDVAAAANAFAAVDLPSTLAGLPSRSGEDPGAVGVYGRGATTLIALPLRGQVARPLRERLRSSGKAQETSVGTLAPVGPVGLLVTDRRERGSFLLAGTVTGETLQRAAAQLLAAQP